jgi:hypothetical protein
LDCVSGSHVTLSTRLNVPDHRRRHPGIRKLPGVDALNIPIHRTRVHKGVMVYDGDAVVDVLVDIGHIGDLINRVIVIDVGDLHHAYTRVSHVHILNVARASVIPRNVDFSRSEREPSYRLRSNADPDTESCAADERNQGWGVDRGDRNWTRNPAPAASYESPTAIMKGRKAPRLVFYPGPSPWGNIGPVSVAIGCPITGDAGRLPNISIFWIIAPAAVVVEIFVAGHILRDVLAAAGSVLALIARLRPPAEIVGRLNITDVVAQLVCA